MFFKTKSSKFIKLTMYTDFNSMIRNLCHLSRQIIIKLIY